MTREIPLTKGMVALVDDADYEWLSQWKWHYTGGYAKRWDHFRHLPMQCAVLTVPSGFTVDHINLNRLDNHRANLRPATQIEQQRNHSTQRNNTSGYRGVWWRADRGRWSVEIYHMHKKFSLGCFDTAEEAALTYNKAAQHFFGPFCRLNRVLALAEVTK